MTPLYRGTLCLGNRVIKLLLRAGVPGTWHTHMSRIVGGAVFAVVLSFCSLLSQELQAPLSVP